MDNHSRVFRCIYAIKNKKDGKMYIGVTVNRLSKRIRHHLWEIRNNRHSNSYLQEAFDLHTEEVFDWIVLEKDIDVSEIQDREISLIEKYKTCDRNFGYNILRGGKERKHVEETKEKLSKTLRNGFRTGRLVHPLIGKHHTTETKSKISKANIGRKGKPCSDEQKAKLSLANTGQKRTPDQKIRMSLNRKAKSIPGLNKNSREVVVFDNDGLEIQRFPSIRYASKELGFSDAFLGDLCRGRRNSSAGLIIKYA